MILFSLLFLCVSFSLVHLQLQIRLGKQIGWMHWLGSFPVDQLFQHHFQDGLGIHFLVRCKHNPPDHYLQARKKENETYRLLEVLRAEYRQLAR